MSLTFVNGSVSSRNETSSDFCFQGGNILHIVLCSLVILFGAPGNCLIIRVYWSKPRKTSTNVLIMGLAWADLFACLLLVHAIITNCLFGIGELPTPLVVLRYFLLSSVATSLHMTSLIAFDRYDCICRPKRRLLNYHRAVRAALAATLHSLAVCSLYLVVLVFPDHMAIPLIICAVQIIYYTTALVLIIVCYRTVYRTIRNHVTVGVGASQDNSGQNPNDSRRKKMAFVKDAKYSGIISLLSAAVSPYTGPLHMQSTFDVSVKETEPVPSTSTSDKMIRPLQASTTNQHKGSFIKLAISNTPGNSDPRAPSAVRDKNGSVDSKSSNRVLQKKTTRMLLVTSVVFLLSWVPYWIFMASLLATILGAEVSPEASFAFEKFAYIMYLNSAVNPIIYSLANRRFRRNCKDVLQKYKCF